MLAEKKLKALIKQTKAADYGELKKELEVLNDMVENMKKAVAEPMLEALETIDRRMKAYQDALSGNIESVSDLQQSAAEMLKEADLTRSQSDFSFDPHEFDGIEEEVVDESEQEELQEEYEEEKVVEEPEITVKQQKFFEKLGHFFEALSIADERAAVVDPVGKIANMKVRSHSKGIQEKDGSFNPAYQQRDIHGKKARHLADLYAAAEQAQPQFQSTLYRIVDAVGGLKDADVIETGLKERARASQKVQEEYTYRNPGPGESWLYDILRASIHCRTIKQMADVNKWLKENVHIVECDNRFAMPRFDGYRDIIYYISVPYKDDLSYICEIPVHH